MVSPLPLSVPCATGLANPNQYPFSWKNSTSERDRHLPIDRPSVGTSTPRGQQGAKVGAIYRVVVVQVRAETPTHRPLA